MGVDLTVGNSLVLDFGEANSELLNLDFFDTDLLADHVFGLLEEHGVQYGVGGYNEERVIYQRSELFDSSNGSRFIHLGIDIWTKAGHSVFAPLNGRVHSFIDNAGFGNYGPTLILEHQLDDGFKFFTLYGHLAEPTLPFAAGSKITAGQKIAEIGTAPSNGDWPPHLHFQIVMDMLDFQGDFPGVATLADRDSYLDLCPDPNLILRHPLL
jgi:murein DD-endopeptidase MepM/ murein hydrolase activator NlpD